MGYINKDNERALTVGEYLTVFAGQKDEASSGQTGEIFNDYADNTASGRYSHAEGLNTTASNTSSHAEGNSTAASGENSHAEGMDTTASGTTSHAEGNDTNANGNYSHTEGLSTISEGEAAHAEGNSTIANGDYSHAEGSESISTGSASHAEGKKTVAYADNSHAEGVNSISKGIGSHAEGNSYTFGTNSHAEGHHNLSPSIEQIFGSATTASAFNSTVSGTTGQSVGIAIGECSHIEGSQTTAYGNYSHAEGISTIAYGTTSHAEGRECRALGGSSHAEGYNTIAPNIYSHACGFYNAYTTGNTGTTTATLWACGCGTSSERKNALEIKMNGDVQGMGFYQTTSDKREKHNITYLNEKELDNIMKLKPCTFIYNNDIEERINYGFIAQDVQEIYPEMVNSSDKDKLLLKYEAIIPVLCKAIQELKIEIDELKKEK